jgi:outer membrane protein OmpA-like peptidoglycan-associated protein
MKNTITFLTVLLVLWIAGCTYFYVCKIRKDCNCNAAKSEMVQPKMEATVTPDSLMTAQTEIELTPPRNYTAWFASGASSCNIAGDDRSHFALVRKYIEDNPQGKVIIAGYADNSGSESLNLKLSSQRAEFIKKQLLEAGVPEMNLVASGKGERDPVSENNTAEGRAKNRRVEIQTNKN